MEDAKVRENETSEEGVQRTLNFSTTKQQTFGHSAKRGVGTNGQCLISQTNVFELANVFVILGFSTPQNAKFVVEVFDPTLRSILECIMQNKPIPGLDFS